MDNEEEMQDMEMPNDENADKDGDALECDYSAYVLFHEGRTGAPCLSFDIIEDNLGNDRNCENPVTCYFVTGSQAARSHVNAVTLMKISNLRKINQEDSESESSEDEDDEASEKLPIMASSSTKHTGAINRIRSANINNVAVCATWSETNQVNIWNLTPMLNAIENDSKEDCNTTPLFTFDGHTNEGFAVDWAQTMPGTLVTGDCSGNIHIWKPGDNGTWSVDSRPYTSHTSSVEDLQWSPNEPHVFASCSVDKSIKIWDERAIPSKACQLTCTDAHASDVNVIHWNPSEPFIASGGDDGKVFVWDLRQFTSNRPVAELVYHSKPVTTVQWSRNDASVLASGGEDDQILQWDLAVERDPAEVITDENDDHVPQQLLFVHKGQKEIKELHWHKQIPGLIISTAHSGFNIFKTISC